MSEYVSKKAVLEWFGLMHLEYSHNAAVSEFIESGIEIFESGAFDADESEGTWKATSEFAFRLNDHLDAEVQRLRAENKRYRKALERIAETDIPYAPMADHSVIRFYEQVAREALASTPTEPSGAELVKCVICKTVAYPNGRWKKAHYGDVCPDCRSGRRIKAPEKVGTEERRHKYFGAEWPEAEGDRNDA